MQQVQEERLIKSKELEEMVRSRSRSDRAASHKRDSSKSKSKVEGIKSGGDFIYTEQNFMSKKNETVRSSPRGHFSDNRPVRNATTELDHYEGDNLNM